MTSEDGRNKSALILEELRSRGRSARVVDVEDEKTKLVIFSLSGDLFAFHGANVKEILPMVDIFFVPGAPDFVLGLINLRGDIESVIDITRFLALPASPINQNSRIAIAEGNGMRSGILLESIVDVADVPVSSIKPALPMLDKTTKDYIAGETTFGDKTVSVLDVGHIFERIRT